MQCAVAMLLVLAALGGCLGGDDGPAQAPETPAVEDGGTETASGTDPDDDDASTASARPPPTTLSLHLSADGGLVPPFEAPAEPTPVPLESGPDVFAALAGIGTWNAPLVELPVLVTEAALELHFGHEAAGVGNPSFPPIGVFFGSEASTISFSFVDGPPSVGPGEVHTVNTPLPLPAGGLVVPAGASMTVAIVLGYAPQGASGARNFVQVGPPDQGTRLTLTAQVIELESGTEELALRGSGVGDGAECFEPGDPTGTALHDFPVELGPDVIGLRAELRRTGGQGQEDLDLVILDAAGTEVAGGHTPSGDERVVLFEPNLAAAQPGTWTVRVVICGAQAQGAFDLEVWTTTRAPAATEPLNP